MGRGGLGERPVLRSSPATERSSEPFGKLRAGASRFSAWFTILGYTTRRMNRIRTRARNRNRLLGVLAYDYEHENRLDGLLPIFTLL